VNPAKKGEIYKMSYAEERVEYIGMTQTTKEDRERTHLEYNDNPINKYGTNYKLEHLAWVLFMRTKDLKFVESSYIAKSILYSQFENVNKDQTGKCKRRRIVVEIPIVNNPIQITEVLTKPTIVLRHTKNNAYFRMLCSIKKLPKANLSKKFGTVDGRIVKSFKSLDSEELMRVENILLKEAKSYLEGEGILQFEIVRENYEIEDEKEIQQTEMPENYDLLLTHWLSTSDLQN
jgi:hypothetical protein